MGARIRARREARELTQGRLARMLPGAVEGTQVSRWERGVAFPEYQNVKALAEALGVSEEELLAGPGELG